MTTAAHLGQQAVWLVLAIVSYAWVCRAIGRKLEATERELEASQLRIAHLRTDLAIAEYLDGLNQHRVVGGDTHRDAYDGRGRRKSGNPLTDSPYFDERSFALDMPDEAA